MRKTPLAFLVAMALVVAGCGGTKTTTVTTSAPVTTSDSQAATTAPATGTTTTTQAAKAAAVSQCNDKPYGSGTPVTLTSASGLTCTEAAAEQAKYKWTGNNSFSTPGGFTCTSSGRGASGYQIRCAKGSQAYRIEFSD
jgi:hypothetical protein